MEDETLAEIDSKVENTIEDERNLAQTETDNSSADQEYFAKLVKTYGD